MAELRELLQKTSVLHKHLCPRQVLGVRMGTLAAGLLQLELPQPNKRLLVFVETDGCFADGISVATGCTLGHRTLRLLDYGKVAATFVDAHTNRAWRIYPHPSAREQATQAAPAARSHWHAQVEAYQTLPDPALFCWQAIELTISLTQLISRPGIRVTCAHCGEEILNGRELVRDGTKLCRSCAGERYYSVTSAAASD